jgi:hypothetical protein
MPEFALPESGAYAFTVMPCDRVQQPDYDTAIRAPDF